MLKYTHQAFQNELVDLMSKQVLSKLMLDIKKSPFYSIISNEYNDISSKEQLSLCIRWVHPETFEVFENFVGFYQIRDIKSDTIVEAIKDILVRLQLDFKNLRGQTYDGASNMLGKKSGVAAQLKSIQPEAKETNCHGHSLNLSVKDVTQESRTVKDTMGTVGEICILGKYSPKQENLLGEIQSNIEGITEGEEFVKRKVTTLDKLCPTRWTVRAKCYQKIIDNYESLVELW